MALFSSDLPNGNRLVIVETSSSGGGRWDRPGFLSLVEIQPETEFTSVKAKNVVAVIARRGVDLRSKGPRSEYGLELAALKSLAEVTGRTALLAA